MFFRTDLALERRDIYRKANNLEDEIPGIKYNVEKIGKPKITTEEITTKEGEEALNKKKPKYRKLYNYRC